jgi:hypothetical protein
VARRAVDLLAAERAGVTFLGEAAGVRLVDFLAGALVEWVALVAQVDVTFVLGMRGGAVFVAERPAEGCARGTLDPLITVRRLVRLCHPAPRFKIGPGAARLEAGTGLIASSDTSASRLPWPRVELIHGSRGGARRHMSNTTARRLRR